MGPPAARWSEHVCVLIARDTRGCELAEHEQTGGQALDWSAHAIDAGYADQSHLVRECKAFSGRTPAQIVRQVRHDEADWAYRLIGQTRQEPNKDPLQP